jgi:phospholipid/cholesterol/gamma-HCH transport system substrate-binding protein
MSKESKVGLFFVVGILMLFALSTQVGSLKYGSNDNTYTLKAKLPNVSGLEKNAKIKSRGMQIGYIEDLKLNVDDVILVLKINKETKIPKDSILTIEQESLLGVKYLNIKFSNNTNYLSTNGYLVNTKEYSSMDETTTNISNVAKTLDKFIIRLDNLVATNEQNINKLLINFNDTVLEFKEVGKEFKQTGKTINQTLPSIMNKFSILEDRYITLANRFDKTGKIINNKLPAILTKFETLEDGVNDIVANNKKRIEVTLDSINDAFVSVNEASKSVTGAVKKVDKYLDSTTKSVLNIGFVGEYAKNDEDSKTIFSIDYSPKKDTSYLIDLVSTNDYRQDSIGNIASTKLHEKGRTLYTVQYAKKYDKIRYRAGIIENTGGVGIDYYKNKNLKLSLDAYDFNAYNDARGDKPHLKTVLKYKTDNNLQFYTGYDNMLNRKADNIVFGVGVEFKDDDLKYFLGSMAK